VVDEGIVARADPILFERIVENLVSNAAKHTPPGTRIEVSAVRHGVDALVAVSDDGPGIPREELEHLGERFFRGGDPLTRPIRGTGLGLSFVKEILKLHDQELEVWSEEGVGSRFCFRLPLADSGFASSSAPDIVETEDAGRDASAAGEGARTPSTEPGERFETVLTATRLGAEWALAAMYRDLNPRFLRYFEVRAPGRAGALASQVWQEVAAGLHEFEGDEVSFRRWVFSLARARVMALRPEEIAVNERGRTSIEALGDAPATDAALAKLSELPPDEADVLLLALLGDLAIDDLASVTGRRPAAIRALQRRGLELLSDEPVTVGNGPGAAKEGA
jgi:DNA-directed RNA polymerase specialized sigma24 family protein/anti-sigma regulatory factor (Ser/Thr protein kinase)